MARSGSLLPPITTKLSAPVSRIASLGPSRSQPTVSALSLSTSARFPNSPSPRAASRSYVIPASSVHRQPRTSLCLDSIRNSSHSLYSTSTRIALPLTILTLGTRTMSSASNSGLDKSSSTTTPSKFTFGPFDVSTQVFYETPLSFALVNLKPLLPGHVLVCPKKPHRRLTDLDAAELVDLFAAVQVVQKMLASFYFKEGSESIDENELLQQGSFNIAVQDGPEAGQTVPHVHVHVLPRIRGATAKDLSTEGDALYEKMTEEPGNVGGAQWDAASDDERQNLDGSRPRPGGRFPRIEDASREARTMQAMEAEAAEFRKALSGIGVDHGVASLKE